MIEIGNTSYVLGYQQMSNEREKYALFVILSAIALTSDVTLLQEFSRPISGS